MAIESELIEFIRQLLQSDVMVKHTILLLGAAVIATRKLEPIILKIISIIFRQ